MGTEKIKEGDLLEAECLPPHQGFRCLFRAAQDETPEGIWAKFESGALSAKYGAGPWLLRRDEYAFEVLE